jgi:hypothetical protein
LIEVCRFGAQVTNVALIAGLGRASLYSQAGYVVIVTLRNDQQARQEWLFSAPGMISRG